MSNTRYLIALGSNQRHVRFGLPRTLIETAIEVVQEREINILARSSVLSSRPIGPSSRRYANAVIAIETPMSPNALLESLKQIEESFGPRRGQRWSRRVLDLDIILWSEGAFFCADPALAIPHPAMHIRAFVLGPANEIAADWRDPLSGLTVRQLTVRQKRPKPLDPKPKRH